ncbi:hypothetical protein P691DRAFT_807360 [Macrolepiota fuliginosa MF-IS2]|uniref:Secreted protein n=1 Tax=Macrolepiota fuliginosa MF-IS2 TaxID=1400762 RepID=A0A9P5X4M8_9AGAR|nr:hypothetical protein P691DRAFT_807360 [Macrolepiota fuliginosa MF-IS2]
MPGLMRFACLLMCMLVCAKLRRVEGERYGEVWFWTVIMYVVFVRVPCAHTLPCHQRCPCISLMCISNSST